MSLITRPENPINTISVGITWIDGRILFKDGKKWGNAYYGICHFSKGVFAITPIDWPRVKMLTGFKVSPTEDYCERAHTCLWTSCVHNRYDKQLYIAEFADCGEFSLGLPANFGKETIPWFAQPPWKEMWGQFIIPISGGRLEFDEEQAKKVINE